MEKQGNDITLQYVKDIEYEYAGMINALNYICHEAELAKLDLVSLHLKIAIEELKEFPISGPVSQ